jgi:hypothetical protein
MIKYGLEKEKSDIRAHVSCPGKHIIAFRTEDMLCLINNNDFPSVNAYQQNVDYATAIGLLVPISATKGFSVIVPSTRWDWDRWFSNIEQMKTSEKGRAAVITVKAAIKAGVFPLWPDCYENKNIATDISGTDIIVKANRRIQVKYDHTAHCGHGGTGNLFIQTHETNPLRQY